MKKFLSIFLASALAASATSFLFGCKPAAMSGEVVALRVSETPTTVQYDVDGTFSANGGKIKVIYGDGRINELDMNADGVELSKVDTSVAGRQTVTVSYGEMSTCFVVYVGEASLPDDKPVVPDIPTEDKTVARIVVSTIPTKTEYFVGDEPDFSGGVLTVTYTDRTTGNIPFSNKDVTFDNVNNATKGNKSVTVRYGGKRATFSVRFLGVAGIVTFKNYGESDLQVKVAENNGAVEPQAPTRTGYTFAGWYSDSECIYPYNFSSKNVITKDTTIYSYWKDNTQTYHEVNIDLNYYGVTPSAYKQTVKAGEAARLIADPVRGEFTFGGWFTDKALTSAYTAGSAINADTTLYAKWNKAKVGSSTYTFEAEDTDLTGKTGMSNSGSPIGADMISSNANLGASGSKFVTYLYNKGLSLEFHIASSEEADATIVFYIAAELDNINISQSNYKITVNGEAPDYGTLNLPNGDSFKGWITMNVRLKEGYNLIQLTTDNDVNPIGNGTYNGTAPMVDCIKITTEAVLTWDKNYNLPVEDNY